MLNKKFYEVEVTREDYFTVQVWAEDESEARDNAENVICESDDPWSDFGSHSNGFSSTDCNEIEPSSSWVWAPNDPNDEYAPLPKNKWLDAINQGDTELGYINWVNFNLAMEMYDEGAPTP